MDKENLDKNLLLEQYKIYCYEKESFTNRNFATNKFYLCTIIAIFVIMFFAKNITFDYNISANLIMSILGIAVSFFWWANTDAYNTLIKVKLKHVIDEMEKELPIAMHGVENENFMKYKKENRVFLFSDTQKIVAIIIGIIFTVLLTFEIIYPIAHLLYGPEIPVQNISNL